MDGRKRDAKYWKKHPDRCPEGEQLEQAIDRHQASTAPIAALTTQLGALNRNKAISNCEKRKQRNALNANLSRLKQKSRLAFLQAMCANHLKLLSLFNEELDTAHLCQSCLPSIRSLVFEHRDQGSISSTSECEEPHSQKRLKLSGNSAARSYAETSPKILASAFKQETAGLKVLQYPILHTSGAQSKPKHGTTGPSTMTQLLVSELARFGLSNKGSKERAEF